MKFNLAQRGRKRVHGTALAHWEKNWGVSFPERWFWGQGVNSTGTLVGSTRGADSTGSTAGDRQAGAGVDNSADGPSSAENAGSDGSGGSGGGRAPKVHASFVLAGGKLPSPLVPGSWLPDLWLLGVRTVNLRCVTGWMIGWVGGRTGKRACGWTVAAGSAAATVGAPAQLLTGHRCMLSHAAVRVRHISVCAPPCCLPDPHPPKSLPQPSAPLPPTHPPDPLCMQLGLARLRLCVHRSGRPLPGHPAGVGHSATQAASRGCAGRGGRELGVRGWELGVRSW